MRHGYSNGIKIMQQIVYGAYDTFKNGEKNNKKLMELLISKGVEGVTFFPADIIHNLTSLHELEEFLQNFKDLFTNHAYKISQKEKSQGKEYIEYGQCICKEYSDRVQHVIDKTFSNFFYP